MGTQSKTVGGGAATPLADSFIDFLMRGMQTGTFGTGPVNGGSTGIDAISNPFMRKFFGLGPMSPGKGTINTDSGFVGVLNDIFSPGAGKIGGALQTLIQQNDADNIDALRARYGVGGGTAFGTGAQYAEGVMRSREAPALTQTIGNLQLSALSPILSIIAGLSSKGIPQAETITEPSTFAQVMQGLGQVAPIIAAPFTGGMSLAGLGVNGSNLLQAGPTMSPIPFNTGIGPASMPQLGSITIPG